MKNMGVDSSSIRVLLTEYNERTHKGRPHLPPTFPQSVAKDGRSKNWEAEYRRFRREVCKPGDVVVVCLTGHGYQTRDTSGDELDGMDEYVMVQTPQNDGRSQVVKDDDFFRVLVEPECRLESEKRVALRLISDTCHSGTMFDLPYSAKPLRISELNQALTGRIDVEYSAARRDFLDVQEKLKGLDVLAIGGCADSGYGVNCVGTQVGFGGALTISLLEEVKMPYDPMQTVPRSWPIVDFIRGKPEVAIRKITYGLRNHVQVPVLQVSCLDQVESQSKAPAESETGTMRSGAQAAPDEQADAVAQAVGDAAEDLVSDTLEKVSEAVGDAVEKVVKTVIAKGKDAKKKFLGKRSGGVQVVRKPRNLDIAHAGLRHEMSGRRFKVLG
jgi:hypothetical protein